ncbi:ABC transporter permease [Methanococcoides alaskense]|uniref:Lipooligosaccharide transport system permease protein n=1 Tax=Methanococcoides alaskense TaxID=325778 RepID=A0AA90TZG5_9EURY|nr:ABC transporter permease [Methanococcoides alaskense]MDA0524751.1 ABC transporter permease [Methanococcoides alaskense]MDR6223128.1 lipooligosaccharide transport system permease protein [Methanococcoides alaskense]
MDIGMYFKPPELTSGAFKVWRRNKDVFMKNAKLNLLPPFIEPLLYLFAMGFGLGMFIEEIDGVPYAKFIAPALISVSVMYGAFFECSYGSYVRMYYQKTFDAIIATPLSIEDVIIGELLWGATRSTISATLMLPVIALFGLITFPHSLLIIPFAFLAGLLFACLGMCIAAVTPNIMSINYPIMLFITPMFLFSGTFFPLNVLPEIVQYIALAILPLTHVVMIIRALTFGTPGLELLFNLAWIIGVCAIGFVVSVNMMKKRLVV